MREQGSVKTFMSYTRLMEKYIFHLKEGAGIILKQG